MKKMLMSLALAMVLSLTMGSAVFAAAQCGAGGLTAEDQAAGYTCDANGANGVCGNAGVTCSTACTLCTGNGIGANELGTQYAGQIGLGGQDIRTTIASIIRTAMGLLGIVAVVVILIGGFTWMTAGGNDDKVGEAKKWIFSGIIGLVIILSAYALSSYVINQLLIATSDNPNVVPIQ